MDETMFINIVKNTAIFSSVVGILAGLDLLCGAKVICRLRKVLDRVFDIDQIILRFLTTLRAKLDSAVYIDDVIIKTKTRVILGAVLLFFSILMILVAVTTRIR